MGFGWEEVHEIAEQLEHIDSPVFFDRMDELMGFPKIDPHGSPIPDKDGEISSLSRIKLSDCKEGEKVTLVAIANSKNEFLKFLDSRDLSLGTKLEVLSVEPFDSSMTVSYNGHPSEVLSLIVSDSLLVEYRRPAN